MYGAQGVTSHVDPAREHLVATDEKPLLQISPTCGVLVQHARRAAYQAGQIWGVTPDRLEKSPISSWLGLERDAW
ncbi:DNA polymerase [Frankliniella fusca]|uniref:DNA polymerase n=1 Tax=Frankliniella fusca TaxID=407009 RepID=A0AAE1LLF5_9NEOP|nr:DNA polymerase [Frankliniella fusca]